MSRRDTDRDRDSRRTAAASARTNEYFVPKDGIDREVITADICRYLGNDALVRPGSYEDPQTRQPRQGYFITAYRNLTTAMIADLKADSERWDNERRQTANARGQPSNVGYRDSTTHQSRQYYGPTEPQVAAAPSYSSAPSAPPQVTYNDGPPYQQANYSQPAGSGYPQPGYVISPGNYYAGADLRADLGAERNRVPAPTGVNIPRTNVSNDPYSANTSYQQPDVRANSYYPGQPGTPVSQGQTYPPQQPQDYNYGRAAPPTDNSYSAQDTYDARTSYQEGGPYAQSSQAPMTQAAPVAVPNTSSRRERERGEPEPRDRHSHRSRR